MFVGRTLSLNSNKLVVTRHKRQGGLYIMLLAAGCGGPVCFRCSLLPLGHWCALLADVGLTAQCGGSVVCPAVQLSRCLEMKSQVFLHKAAGCLVGATGCYAPLAAAAVGLALQAALRCG